MLNCTWLRYLFIGWGEVNKTWRFGVADFTVGEGTVQSYERQWFVKVKQDFLDKPRSLILSVQQTIKLFHTPYVPQYKVIPLHSLQLSENTYTGYIQFWVQI